MALSIDDANKRTKAVKQACHQFLQDAISAARAVPAAIQRAAAEKQPDGPAESEQGSSASDRDQSAHPGIHSLRLLSGHGFAGGAKLVDDHRGLFLKTPDDSLGIYGSLVMAGKVMKLEAKASEAVHGMDSTHISAPLTVVLDVPCGSSTPGLTQRVQV